MAYFETYHKGMPEPHSNPAVVFTYNLILLCLAIIPSCLCVHTFSKHISFDQPFMALRRHKLSQQSIFKKSSLFNMCGYFPIFGFSKVFSHNFQPNYLFLLYLRTFFFNICPRFCITLAIVGLFKVLVAFWNSRKQHKYCHFKVHTTESIKVFLQI